MVTVKRYGDEYEVMSAAELIAKLQTVPPETPIGLTYDGLWNGLTEERWLDRTYDGQRTITFDAEN